MEESLNSGNVVVVSFPFSDLSDQKRRPALILAQAEFNNLVLCQITSKPYTSQQAIPLKASDFEHGSLPQASYIRPDKIFTAESSIIHRQAGKISKEKLATVKQVLATIFDI